MSESVGITTESPYAECFRTIERSSSTELPIKPAEAYSLYYDYLLENRFNPLVYTSMAITSGGFARDDSLSISEVISRNSSFGDQATAHILSVYPQFKRDHIMCPSVLGKVEGWRQSDYLLFWAHAITGLRPVQAAAVDRGMRDSGAMELPAFTQVHSATAQPEADYERFVDLYIEQLNKLEAPKVKNCSAPELRNVAILVKILDNEVSLGARAEELPCRRLGIAAVGLVAKLESPAHDDTTNHLHELGASYLGDQTTSSGLAISWSEGAALTERTEQILCKLGGRRTGLINALQLAEYYRDHPETLGIST